MCKTRFLAPLTLTCIVAFLAGCGDGRPSRVKVSGNVTIDGQPLKFGGISFRPIKGGRNAGGGFEKDGKYLVSMYEKNDGLPPGAYTVAVDAIQFINDESQRHHAPKRYSDHNTSQLTAEITEETVDLNFDLTWEGDKHSEPWVEK